MIISKLTRPKKTRKNLSFGLYFGFSNFLGWFCQSLAFKQIEIMYLVERLNFLFTYTDEIQENLYPMNSDETKVLPYPTFKCFWITLIYGEDKVGQS